MATCIDGHPSRPAGHAPRGAPGTPSGIIRAITTMTTPHERRRTPERPRTARAAAPQRGPRPRPERRKSGGREQGDRHGQEHRRVAQVHEQQDDDPCAEGQQAPGPGGRWPRAGRCRPPRARSSGATDHASQGSWSTMPGSSGSSRRATARNGPRPSSRPTRSHHGADTRSAITPIASSPSAAPAGWPHQDEHHEQSKPPGETAVTDGPAGRGPQGRRHSGSASPVQSGRRAPRRRARRLPKGVRASSRHRR